MFFYGRHLALNGQQKRVPPSCRKQQNCFRSLAYMQCRYRWNSISSCYISVTSPRESLGAFHPVYSLSVNYLRPLSLPSPPTKTNTPRVPHLYVIGPTVTSVVDHPILQCAALFNVPSVCRLSQNGPSKPRRRGWRDIGQEIREPFPKGFMSS